MQMASAASPQLLQNDFLAVYVGGSCQMQAVYDKRGGVNVTVKHDMAQVCLLLRSATSCP